MTRWQDDKGIVGSVSQSPIPNPQSPPYKVVANLPYYITLAVLRHLLESSHPPTLAVVMVHGEDHAGPFYVRQPFTHEPDWAVTSINLDLDQLLDRSASPGAAS